MVASVVDTTPQQIDAEGRKALLAQAVANEVRGGWHVQSQTDYQAVLVKGQRTSHGVHLFASIVTATLWVPVWIVMIFRNRDRHRVVNVDSYGNANIQK